jgi:serine/threonine protein kinase
MSLAAGSKLGPYEILSPLGAGGMGEVFRARDTRLGRDVAIKIFPERFSGRPELRERFEREARTISALNHARICTIYDVGHQDDVQYLVMEFLEGETLAERIQKGPLPLREIVRIGMEICEALDAAHRAWIIHRDLKPANVMLTANGAKLMDFGLAKASAASASGGTTETGAPLLSAAETSVARARFHRLRRPGRSSARFNTCRRSSSKAKKPTRGPTFLRSAQFCTKWRQGSARSPVKVRSAWRPQFSRKIRSQCARFNRRCRLCSIASSAHVSRKIPRIGFNPLAMCGSNLNGFRKLRQNPLRPQLRKSGAARFFLG